MLERTLSRDHYLSPELFAREKERIFLREWFHAGREEDVAAPGNYLVVDVAGESVLVVRTKEGALRAYYNVCRHRGCQLVLTGTDSTARHTLHSPLPQETPMPVKLESPSSPNTTASPSAIGRAS